MNKLNLALSDYEEWVRMEPESIHAQLSLGQVLFKCEKFREASDSIRQGQRVRIALYY